MSSKLDDSSPQPEATKASTTSSERLFAVERLLMRDHQNPLEREQTRQQVASLALDLQRESASSIRLLEGSLRQVSARSADEASVALSLSELRHQIELLDPSSLASRNRWFHRFLRWLFHIDPPLQRFLFRYDSVRITIEEILLALKEGREQLRRDNITLAADQQELLQTSEKLAAAIANIEKLRGQLSATREKEQNREIAEFIDQDLLFPLHQRSLDLHQQLAVNQQGTLALDLIIKNNLELIRGVDRALFTTASGFRIAATVAVTLAEQRDISDQIQTAIGTTDELLAEATKELKGTKTSIKQQITLAANNIEKLKKAWSEIRTSIEEVESRRSNALLTITASIEEMTTLSHDTSSLGSDK
jgi:uncharacterized protein YaaN involved in tellurite resistance